MRRSLNMSAAAIADADRALTELSGPDQPGDNTLRKLNLAAFVGERYGRALVADWRAMRAEIARLEDVVAEVAQELEAERFGR